MTESGSNIFNIACVQMNSGDDLAVNIEIADGLVREAAAAGAQLVCLPENAFLMAVGEKFHSQVFTMDEHPAISAAGNLAADLNIWLLIGSVAVKVEKDHTSADKKYFNRSILINGNGDIAAIYDKIHLFDVSLPSGESHKESRYFMHGGKVVVTTTPWGNMGLSVCYDVRFPHIYRVMAQRGADFLTIPAAFTRFTGEKGGWHVLCRARAMETGCFVFAPAQCGKHSGGRETYGHSLIIDPWGDILAEAGEEPGIITAEINPQQVQQTRSIMPSLEHDREFN